MSDIKINKDYLKTFYWTKLNNCVYNAFDNELNKEYRLIDETIPKQILVREATFFKKAVYEKDFDFIFQFVIIDKNNNEWFYFNISGDTYNEILNYRRKELIEMVDIK